MAKSNLIKVYGQSSPCTSPSGYSFMAALQQHTGADVAWLQPSCPHFRGLSPNSSRLRTISLLPRLGTNKPSALALPPGPVESHDRSCTPNRSVFLSKGLMPTSYLTCNSRSTPSLSQLSHRASGLQNRDDPEQLQHQHGARGTRLCTGGLFAQHEK